MIRHISLALSCGAESASCIWPFDQSGSLAGVDVWTPPGFPGAVQVALANAATGSGSWELRLAAASAWPRDVTAEVRVRLGIPAAATLWPMYHGVVERRRASQTHAASFRGAGRPHPELPDEQRLALPLIALEAAAGMLLVGADPGFSATIGLEPGQDGVDIIFGWRWLADAGRHASELRRIIVQPVDGLREALDRWFTVATPEVPAGPAWLHDVALADYDYFAKDGRGWYADIDAAAAMIAPSDRHRAIFCLHGWYDQVGRYCYDSASRSLDETWTVFPHIQHPELLKLQNRVVLAPGVPPGYTFRHLDRYRPIALTWDDIRARLRYARERGFRTAFYHATGMQAAGSAAAHIAAGTGLDIPHALWIGPDLVGETFLRNPLHHEIRDWFQGYTAALLERVGDLIDALVLDEAYYIGFGTLGPPACPGYADRAQFNLIHAAAALCHRFRPDLAYLTADHLGTWTLESRAFPYSLAADGIYHDAWCSPQSWEAARIPAWRNVIWSCNWTPVSSFANTRYGVLAHDAPIAITNGCFGDDTGLADMDEQMAGQVADLWRVKLNRRRERILPVTDIV